MNARTIKKRYLRSAVGNQGHITIRVPISALPPMPEKPDMSHLGESSSTGWTKFVDGVKIRTVLMQGWANFNPERPEKPLAHLLRSTKEDKHYRIYTGYAYREEKGKVSLWPDLDFIEANQV